jgi:hypothetical protein
VFSAHGVTPLPPDVELVNRLKVLPARPDLTEAVARLSSLTIGGPDDVAAVRTELDSFVALVRRITGAGDFPRSFRSAAAWRTTLDIGFDWLRLGAYMSAALPLDEVRDLLDTGGRQPHDRAGQR